VTAREPVVRKPRIYKLPLPDQRRPVWPIVVGVLAVVGVATAVVLVGR
jgi:hypothetical protein